MENKEFIKEGFKRMFETSAFDEAFIRTMLASSYIQHVDGKTLVFEDFIRHLKALKEKTQSIKIHFKTLATEGEVVFSNHVVTVIMNDHSQTMIHVIAEFHIKEGKVYYCDELTSLIDGDAQNSDLGSTL